MTSTSCADCARCPPAASSWPLPLGRPRAPTAGSTHAQWGSPRRRWWRVSVERAAGRVAGQSSTLVRVRHARGWLHTAHLVDRGTIYCLSRMGAKFGIPVLMAMFKDVPSHNEGGLRPGASVCCTARARPPHHRLAEPGRGRTGEQWRPEPPAKFTSLVGLKAESAESFSRSATPNTWKLEGPAGGCGPLKPSSCQLDSRYASHRCSCGHAIIVDDLLGGWGGLASLVAARCATTPVESDTSPAAAGLACGTCGSCRLDFLS